MIEHRIFARYVAPRRYRVQQCLPCNENLHDALVADRVCGVISIASPRGYRVGAFINPTRVIKELIAARRPQ
jgi:hypothetical protein